MRCLGIGSTDIDPHIPVFYELVPGNALRGWRVPVVKINQHLFIGAIPVVVVVEFHGFRQAPEQLYIGYALTWRGNGRLVERDVQVSPGNHDVQLLGLHGCGRIRSA